MQLPKRRHEIEIEIEIDQDVIKAEGPPPINDHSRPELASFLYRLAWTSLLILVLIDL